jgi:hypothetical protein
MDDGQPFSLAGLWQSWRLRGFGAFTVARRVRLQSGIAVDTANPNPGDLLIGLGSKATAVFLGHAPQIRVRKAVGTIGNGQTVSMQVVLRTRRKTMEDDTRQLLKIFGVAVTDAEAEAGKLAGLAAQLSANSTREEIVNLLKDANELNRELNTRWLSITERVFAIQCRLQTQLVEAAAKLQDKE